MSKRENALDDYSRTPVPEDKTVGALHVALVLIGGTIAVPVFLLSSELSMAALGIGIPALLMLIFSTWSSNVRILYSGSLSVATLLESLKFWQIVLGFGLIGMLLALVGIMDYFVPFLVVLGIAIPPVGAIYVIHFFMNRHQLNGAEVGQTEAIKIDSMGAWAAGFMAGLLSSYDVASLFSTPSIDAISVSSLVYFALAKWPVKNLYNK